MKTSIKILSAACLVAFSATSSLANSMKLLEPIEKQNIDFKVDQFKSYLVNGTPHQFEGVYESADSRYQIALVKNDSEHHDFIGISLLGDNEYWEEGEIKFNFIRESNALKGYYYTQSGAKIPVEFNINADTLAIPFMRKVG